jgi:hypothetical protein
MLKYGAGLILTEVLLILFSFGIALPVFALECLSPSYSVQKGRDYLSDVELRELMGNEYQDLKDLFQGLNGDWAGSGQMVSCEGPEDAIRKDTETYTIHSQGKTDSGGQFTLESTLYYPEKKTKQHDALHLFLGKDRLTTRPDVQAADIELVSASQNELTFVKKNRARGDGGGFIGQESVISIKKTAAASLVVENLFFVNGRLKAFSTWQLERN